MNDPKNFLNQNQPQDMKNVLVISDLADNVYEQDLQIFFEKFKDSLIVIQMNRPRSDFYGSKSNSAIVIFKEFKEAEKAKYELNMRKLKGKTIRITWHERDSSLRYSNQVNLYIKNIPTQVTPRQFYEYFCKFGEVVSAKLAEDEEGIHLGYGYVHFSTNEAKNKCLEDTDEKEIWPGSKLKVENFQKKNERSTQETMNPNKSIFMKNFPEDYDEKKLKELLKDVKVSFMKMVTDKSNRKYAIVSVESEEEANKVKNLNKTDINGNELYVDNLMNKHDRKRYLANKIYDQNIQLTRKFRDCNLHVKNLPIEMKEEDLKLLFTQFGDIKSVKVPETITVTKIKGEFVERTTSCGFGFVCFTSSDSAKLAFEDMNGKTLEGSQRPLIISYFMPKNERSQVLGNTYSTKKNMSWEGMGLNQPFMGGDMFGRGPYRMPPHLMNMQPQTKTVNNTNNNLLNNNTPNTQGKQTTQPQETDKKQVDEPNYDLLKNMEDDASKKDYLGEFIFRKIESHFLTETNNLTMDHIGKITGMILGIEDINEIIDICKNENHLTSRIVEALSLLNSV